MKTISKHFLFLILFSLATSCHEDFLEIKPQGDLSFDALLTTEEGVESLLIGAYSVLDGQVGSSSNGYNSAASNWTFGDVVSDDAYKGSSGVSDQQGIHLMEIFSANSGIIDVARKWAVLYEGISRCNLSIRAFKLYNGRTEEWRTERIAEAKFLRGHYYFELKKVFNRIPYIDEQERTLTEIKKISNTSLSDSEIWRKIENDFAEASQVLPSIQQQVGRATKGAALAYLAKAKLYQQKWSEVITNCDLVIADPFGYQLLPDYSTAFLPRFDNSKESVFAVQNSINDGSNPNGIQGSVGDRLSMVGGPYPRLYGFHRPSQNLVNSFKTDNSGLPLTDTFNDTDLTSTENVDPRLDFIIGRPGIPFLDAGIYTEAWNRGNDTYGTFANKKIHVPISLITLVDPPYVVNERNTYIIRLADVLLWKAEALIETGQFTAAQDIINQLRLRAKNSKYVMTNDGAATAANYKISLYTSPWANKETALKALRIERRIELAMEGHRFFDLVRWGVAKDVLNKYVEREKSKRTYLQTVFFTTGKNEYFPIPQSQIDLSQGNLIQNPNYF
jgi:starch-binding outer membrane protein, SusD/RagB family